MTTSLEESACKKLRLYKLSLRADASVEDINRYREYRNNYNRIKQKLCIPVKMWKMENYKNNTKELWKIINRTISRHKNSGSIILYITAEGLKVQDSKEIANTFGSFYANLGANLANKITQSQMLIEHYLSKIPQNCNSMLLSHITQQDLKKTIDQLPNRNSSGHNRVSNIMLKSLSESITYPSCLLFNQSFSTGIFPAIMKIAEVIPLYKNKTTDIEINYRPISLLMKISKLLEKLMYKCVYKFITKNGILYESQYGFRNNCSCEQAIQELFGKILQAKEANQHAASIFLDLLKAFIMLDHSVLLAKLERYRIRGVPLTWFQSYLHGRSLIAKVPVSINKISYSEKFNITYGPG